MFFDGILSLIVYFCLRLKDYKMLSLNTPEQATELLLRIALHNLLYLPIKVSQYLGTFFFSLGPNAELQFSWVSLPVAMIFLKTCYAIMAITVFLINSRELVFLFGNWAEVDEIVYTLVTFICQFADTFVTLICIRERKLFQIVHQRLIQLNVDLYLDNAKKFPMFFSKRMRQFEHFQRTNKYCIVFTILTGVFFFITGFGSAVALGLNVIHAPISIIISIPMVLLFVVSANTFRLVHYYIIGTVIAFVLFAYKAINDRCKWGFSPGESNEKGLNQLLSDINRVNTLVRDINKIFRWMLLAAVGTLIFSIICFLFQMFSWLSVVGLGSIPVQLTQVIANLVPFCYLCGIATRINKEVLKKMLSGPPFRARLIIHNC